MAEDREAFDHARGRGDIMIGRRNTNASFSFSDPNRFCSPRLPLLSRWPDCSFQPTRLPPAHRMPTSSVSSTVLPALLPGPHPLSTPLDLPPHTADHPNPLSSTSLPFTWCSTGILICTLLLRPSSLDHSLPHLRPQ